VPKDWIWTDHIEYQITERELSRELVETVINTPDEIIPGKYGRLIYHKIVNDRLVRVVADGNVLITVYITSKIQRYMEGRPK